MKTCSQYSTHKIVVIRGKKIGCLKFAITLSIFVYVVFYVLLYRRAYQETCHVQSQVTTKVKGTTVIRIPCDKYQVPHELCELYNKVWDVPEYVVPPAENDAFFVMTNVVITPNQTIGLCDESPKVRDALCNTSCEPAGRVLYLGNGETTGRCVPSTQLNDTRVCEVRAWCPVETDQVPLTNAALLQEVENHTVLIKNTVSFPECGEQYVRTNILRTSEVSYLTRCIYHGELHPLCPVFRIGDIVRAAGQNFTQMALKGGVISITIHWYCNMDWNFFDHCRPKYTFRRLDSPDAYGWSFRHAQHHEYRRRTLFKAYGIKFVIAFRGEGRKCSLLKIMLNIGAGLGLLKFTKIICDFVVKRLLHKRRFYRSLIYQEDMVTVETGSLSQDQEANIAEQTEDNVLAIIAEKIEDQNNVLAIIAEDR